MGGLTVGVYSKDESYFTSLRRFSLFGFTGISSCGICYIVLKLGYRSLYHGYKAISM